MMSKSNTTAQVAVWYFVGATFLFVTPILFIPDAPLWLRVVSLILGVIVMIAGGVQFAREISQRNGGGDRADDRAPKH